MADLLKILKRVVLKNANLITDCPHIYGLIDDYKNCKSVETGCRKCWQAAIAMQEADAFNV